MTDWFTNESGGKDLKKEEECSSKMGKYIRGFLRGITSWAQIGIKLWMIQFS